MALELTKEQIEAGWTTRTLEDSLNLIIDHRGKTPKKMGGDWSETGHRVISAINMKNGGVNSNDHHYVDDEIYSKWMKNPVEIGDVFLTSEAPMGAVAYISKAESTSWVVGQRIYALRADKEHLDGRYLYYLLQSRDIQEQLVARSSGTTVIGIKQAELRQVVLRLPPLVEQKRVAEILGSLDDKIEANNALLNSLDELGNALILQKINDVSETCELFEVAEVMMGQSPAGATLNEDSEGLIFYQGRRDFGFRYPSPRVFTSAPTRVAEPGDILLSVRAPVGDLNRTDEECCVGRGIAAIRAKNSNTAQLFYLLKNMPNLWAPYEGEGTVFSSINRKQVQGLQVPVLDNFEEFEDIEQFILSLTQENLALVKTRNLLIRKLIG